MEQTNLVVTADGKTWDEVTRDVSYIGNGSLCLDADYAEVDYTAAVIMDECRGVQEAGDVDLYNKDFAIAYDRQICLRNGGYTINLGAATKDAGTLIHCYLKINGVITANIYNSAGSAEWSTGSVSINVNLIRGDYLQVFGGNWKNTKNYGFYNITRDKR